MKQLKILSKEYFGLEAIVVALIFIIMGGKIKVGGLLIKTTYLIAAYLILKYFYKLEGRTSIVIALGFLGLAGLLLVARDEGRAVWASQIAFMFLTAGVLWQIAELIIERRTQQQNYSSFWSHKDLVIATIIIVFAFFYSFKFSSKFQVLQQNLGRAQKALFKARRELTTRIAIKISRNGNIVEAGRIADILKQQRIGTITIDNSLKKNYKPTLVQYKTGKKSIADEVVKLISPDYPAKIINLKQKSSFDVIVILSSEKNL